MSYIAYPTRRAVPVAPVPFGDRNTTRLLSFARLALLNRPAGPSPSQAMTRRTAGRPRPLSLEPPGYPSPSCLDRLHDAGSMSRHAPAATLPHRVGLPLFHVRSSAFAPVFRSTVCPPAGLAWANLLPGGGVWAFRLWPSCEGYPVDTMLPNSSKSAII